MKTSYRRIPHGIIALLLLLVLIFSNSSAVFATKLQSVQHNKVRVGFFELEGYHKIDEKGNKSGYGYDFIQMLSRYNNWEPEYVGYEKSWAEAQDMLKNGEIDLLTSARKTSAREGIFDYSTQPIGYSTTVLTVRSGDPRYIIGDASSYQGMRIGMLENNTRNESFAEFAANKNITYEAVIYKSNDEMVTDLQSGEKIDAIVTSNLRSITNEIVLEEFDSSPFYAIVKKGNTHLLDEINYAISLLDIRESGWRTALKNKYYTPDNGSVISLSAAELEYRAELLEQRVVLRVISNPDMAPYSYYQDGILKGIAPRVFEEIADQRVRKDRRG